VMTAGIIYECRVNLFVNSISSSVSQQKLSPLPGF
jgi:hypothetical protein